MRRLLLTSCMSAALLCHPVLAHAEERVSARTAMHDGYSRLVFDWGKPVTYVVTPEGKDAIDISFAKTGAMDASGVEANEKTVRSVEKISKDSENLKVRVKIPAGGNYRQFSIGNKIILDVYGDVKEADAAKAFEPKAADVKSAAAKLPEQKKAEVKPVADTPKVEAKKTEPVTEVKKAETKPVVEKPLVKTETKPAVQEKPKPEPVKTAEQPPVPAVPAATVEGLKKEPEPVPAAAQTIQPHTIMVSSTTAVGMAVFRRNDALWIVLDRPDITVPPELTGPQKNLFPPFEHVDAEGGTAYRTRIPEGLNIAAEGTGLVWKVTLSTADSTAIPVEAQRNFAPGDTLRGGTLFWPMQRVTRVVKMKDPDIGDTILAGTVNNAAQMSGGERDFVDVTMLEAAVGLVAVPRADDVTMDPVGNGVQVTRPGGLALTRVRDMVQKAVAQTTTAEKPGNPKMKQIFDFDRWMMGGMQALRENQQILLSGIAEKDKTGRVQDLLMLAKMNMANDRGQEALGFLNFAESEMPEITQSPEFLALRGAANAMAGKFEMALADLSTPALKEYGELDYWRAYTLSGLEDWQQAKDSMPKNIDLLRSYPLRIQERLVLKLAELALRSANTTQANDLLSLLETNRDMLQHWTKAGMDYLSGEQHRQANEIKKAEDAWTPLLSSKDDLYRAKASLALTMLQLQSNEITRDQAIDRLEGLRYHWRGDELEAQINYRLGKLYLDDSRYQKGFTILKDAVMMAPDTDISREIASFMAGSYKDLFLGDKLYKMSPVDAAALYGDFTDLMPPGDDGNRIIQRLAERMVDADLLDRASALLKNQVDFRLTGRPAADVAVRLAAIDLLNDDSKGALAALDKASSLYGGLEQSSEIAQKQKDIQLLRARALSKMDKVPDALAILNKYPPSPDVNRLRADIAWNAGMWSDAAAALQDLIQDETIDVARPLTQKQADLVLNRAVALNLSGDRVALSDMRTKYAALMDKTPRSKMFDVVTRQRTGSLSSDRESIAALVSEVDLFKDFLDSYKANTNPSN